GSALPVGVPVPWPSETPPPGWLKCNGSAFTASQYPKLAQAYPALKLPDLRGEFIRGWDDGRGADSGRGIGTSQGDAIRNITGTVVGSNYMAYRGASTGAFYGIELSEGTSLSPAGSVMKGMSSGMDVSRQVPTASENRPRNVAFNYIVRAA
ncbi:TPA: tail fiber protein, partial [Enterobacter asburiae]|nr:tail fiber protein [Enterobacter asburiae]HDX4721160.1 tail fiber protein [Enterobacter asburiae]